MELKGGAIDRQVLRDIQMLRLAMDAVTVTQSDGTKAIRVVVQQG